MIVKSRSSFPYLACALIVALAFSAGCKKTPQPVATTPEPPPVDKAAPAAETVKETPMKPVVEEAPAPQRQAGADELNRQKVLKTIYFDFDKYEIRPDQRTTLQANAQKL